MILVGSIQSEGLRWLPCVSYDAGQGLDCQGGGVGQKQGSRVKDCACEKERSRVHARVVLPHCRACHCSDQWSPATSPSQAIHLSTLGKPATPPPMGTTCDLGPDFLLLLNDNPLDL